MKTNINVIKFTIILSVITFFITLFISMNMKFMWFELKYIPNDFLIAIFSGIFGSTFVVLICEFQKYLLLKKQYESMMYNIMIEILARFMTIRTSVRLLIENEDDLVTQGFFEDFKQKIIFLFNQFYSIEYKTWFKKHKLFSATELFIKYSNDEIMKLLDDCAYLDVAIYNERINKISNTFPDKITSRDITIKQLLVIYYNRFNKVTKEIEEYILKIDYNGKYNFKARIEKVKEYHEMYRSNCTVDDFIKNNEEYLTGYK